MLNIILDGFPDEYEGYLIRTDFRVGMQISEALNDVDLAKPEKMMTALRLLYGNGIPPDSDVAESGLRWFMAGGNPDEEHIPDGKPPTFDFEQDNRLLYSAFRARYGIDLTREGLHWFAFLAMPSDLGGCSLSDIIGIRTVPISPSSARRSGTSTPKCRSDTVSSRRYPRLIAPASQNLRNSLTVDKPRCLVYNGRKLLGGTYEENFFHYTLRGGGVDYWVFGCFTGEL